MTVREISVLTALHPTHAAFVPDAWSSLRAQQLPHGWRMRWYVHEDGADATARSLVESLPVDVVSYAHSDGTGGAAEARNLALARASGEISVVFDADDRMQPGALSRVIEALSNGPIWCAAQAIDERNGRLSSRKGGYSARLAPDRSPPIEARDFVRARWLGTAKPGVVGDCWDRFGVLPFHPATFAAHTSAFWAAGGWPGLARDEDTALITAITDLHPGFVFAEEHIIYRHHDHQTSALRAPLAARREFLRKRRAMRTSPSGESVTKR